MKISDPIERGEARADRFEERITGNIYTCSCGNRCSLNEVEILSPDPYGEPFCRDCVKIFIFKRGAE